MVTQPLLDRSSRELLCGFVLLCDDLAGVRTHDTGHVPGKDDLVMFAVSEFGKTFLTLQEEKSLNYFQALWSYVEFLKVAFLQSSLLICLHLSCLSDHILGAHWQNPAFDSLFSHLDNYFLKR